MRSTVAGSSAVLSIAVPPSPTAITQVKPCTLSLPKMTGLESSDSTQLPIASLIESGVKFWIDSGSAEVPMKPELLPGASGDSEAGEVEGTVGAGDGSGLLEHAPIRKSELAAITTPAICVDFNSECMPVIVGQLIFGCKLLGSGSNPIAD